jgi:hypothetical protein
MRPNPEATDQPIQPEKHTIQRLNQRKILSR